LQELRQFEKKFLKQSKRAQELLCYPIEMAMQENAPIPSLLLTSAVHHHLIREKTRTKVGLVIESGEVRDGSSCCIINWFWSSGR